MPTDRLAALVLLGWLVLGTATGLAAESSAWTLPNGLEVLLVPEPGGPVVSVQTWYRVGSVDEGAERTGYARLAARLVGNGTPGFDAQVADMGGRSAAGSWPEVTIFELEVPAGALRDALELEARRMRQVVIDRLAVDRALGALSLETARLDGESAARQRLNALAFSGHPYGQPQDRLPARSDTTLAAGVRAFYDQYYQPDNATLVVVGGFEAGTAKAWIEASYGGYAASGAVSRSLPPLPPAAARRDTLEVGGTGAILLVGFPTPGEEATERQALGMLTTYLDGPGRDQWLGPIEPMARAAGVEFTANRQAGLITVVLRARPGADLEALERGLLAAFDALPTALRRPGTVLLDDLQHRHRLAAAGARRTASGRASAHAIRHVLGAAQTPPGEAVTLDALARAAELLDTTRAQVVVVDPD